MTELDHSVLGVVWRDGPLTAYRVRSRFAGSVTAAWSASTGSIYPAIRRLVARGLIRASAHRDARRTQELRVTASGLRALRAWLGSVTAGLAGIVADPLRTRIQFLGALPRPTAKRFLEEAEADCRSALRDLDSRISEESHGRGSERGWALRGARKELRARLEWIGWVRRRAARPRAKRARPAPRNAGGATTGVVTWGRGSDIRKGARTRSRPSRS